MARSFVLDQSVLHKVSMAGLTSQEFASRAGVSEATLARVGKRERIGVHSALRIVQALADLPANELLERWVVEDF